MPVLPLLAGWVPDPADGWPANLEPVLTLVERALAPASAGEEPIAAAREAFRAAQALGALEGQVLSALTLARVRRLSGRPHLALHILRAVGAVAEPPWRPWIAWESLLAGAATDDVSGVGDDLAGRAVGTLVSCLSAAASGDRARVGAAFQALGTFGAAGSLVEPEVRALRSLLDPREVADPAVAAWLSGEGAAVPFGLHAVGSRDTLGDREAAPVFVYATPERAGRRLLRAGLPLASGAHPVAAGGAEPAASERLDTALSVLLLAGPDGVDRDEFFRGVYGFRFVGERHRSVLENLVYRLRARVGELATIARDEGRVALTLSTPLVVPDPRCTFPLADRVLQSIVELGTPGAAEAARALGLPLRTVQAALTQLVSDGACRPMKQGRHVVYRAADTTFTVRRPAG